MTITVVHKIPVKGWAGLCHSYISGVFLELLGNLKFYATCDWFMVMSRDVLKSKKELIIKYKLNMS